MTPPARHPQGFTLAEIAVVLVIVALLLGGLLAPLASQNDARLRSDNAKALADIREALIGFAAVNGRLPCPANPVIASGTAGAGQEATVGANGPCACTTATSGIAGGAAICVDVVAGNPAGVTGTLPWATLGLSETDTWNNRYTYRVTTRLGRVASGQTSFGCTVTANPANAAFALCTPGDITVQNSAGTALASQIPAIVVSHGKNGLGAWLPNGTQTGGAIGDENENANNDGTFVSDATIDDQLIWIPPNILMNRMIAAGKLP